MNSTKLNCEMFFPNIQFPFHVNSYFLEPNSKIAPHSHEFIELVFIAEGSGTHCYNNSEILIRAGDLFVIEPDSQHGYLVHENTHLLVYNVLFLPSLLSNEVEMLTPYSSSHELDYFKLFLNDNYPISFHLKLLPPEQLALLKLIDQLMVEQNKQYIGYEGLIKTRLIELFIFLSRWNQKYRNLNPYFFEETTLQSVCQYIKNNCEESLTLQQISSSCGMSPTSFATKFKNYTGKTFIEYRNHFRINKAKQLLLTTNKKISYIALEVGFEDLSFFNKQFKQLVGITPRMYRNNGIAN